jgi:cobalamin biosynthesis protein CbiG
VRLAARVNGWELRGYRAAALAGQAVPHPSGPVAAAVGTASVAEAAALLAAGPGAALVLPKTVHGGVTVAIARAAGPPGVSPV